MPWQKHTLHLYITSHSKVTVQSNACDSANSNWFDSIAICKQNANACVYSAIHACTGDQRSTRQPRTIGFYELYTMKRSTNCQNRDLKCKFSLFFRNKSGSNKNIYTVLLLHKTTSFQVKSTPLAKLIPLYVHILKIKLKCIVSKYILHLLRYLSPLIT